MTDWATSGVSRGFVRGHLDWLPGVVVRAQPSVRPLEPHASIKTAHPETLLVPDPLMAVELARRKGYTGNTCDTCGGLNVLQTGHCETCQDCGTTSACA